MRAQLDRLSPSSIRGRMLLIALLPAVLIEFGLVAYFTSQTLGAVEDAMQARAAYAARHLADTLPYALVSGDTARMNALLKTEADTVPDTIPRISQAGFPLLHKPLRPAKLRALLTHLIQQARAAAMG